MRTQTAEPPALWIDGEWVPLDQIDAAGCGPKDRAAAETLDMYYGTREAWYDHELPPVMNLTGAEPAYVEHLIRTEEESR